MRNRTLPAIALIALLATPALAQEEETFFLPLDAELRETSVGALQDTLFDLMALRGISHQAHWNVIGRDFYQDHEFFEELYTSFEDYIDNTGARIRSLGGTVDGRLSAAAEGTVATEREPALTEGEALLQDLHDDWAAVVEAMRNRIDETSDDLVTQDFLIGISNQLEKQLWFLRAHLR